MYVLAVVGPSDSGKTTLVERLTAPLAERGRVGTVKHISCEPDIDTTGKDTARHRSAGAAETYGITNNEWFATGETLTLTDALDALAGRCEYALVEGYSDLLLPKIVLGGREADYAVVERAPSADDVDVDALVETIESLEPYETPDSLAEWARHVHATDEGGAVVMITGQLRTSGVDRDITAGTRHNGTGSRFTETIETLRTHLDARTGVSETLVHRHYAVEKETSQRITVVLLVTDHAETLSVLEEGLEWLEDTPEVSQTQWTVETIPNDQCCDTS